MTYEEYCKARDSYGLTDYAVAKLAKVSRSALSQWKNGLSKPSKRTMNHLELFFSSNKAMNSHLDYDYVIDNPDYPGDPSHAYIITPQIDGYTLKMNDGSACRVTAQEYQELKAAIDIFAKTWIQTRKNNFNNLSGDSDLSN